MLTTRLTEQGHSLRCTQDLVLKDQLETPVVPESQCSDVSLQGFPELVANDPLKVGGQDSPLEPYRNSRYARTTTGFRHRKENRPATQLPGLRAELSPSRGKTESIVHATCCHYCTP